MLLRKKSLGIKCLILLLLVTGSIVRVNAQKSVVGRVTGEDGSALAGVNITVSGSAVGTRSDNEGRYNIAIPSSGKTLNFSHTGYKAQEQTINNRSVINVVLRLDSSDLNEVIVTGYTTTLRKDLTGAVGSVNVEDLQKAPVRSFDEALAGRVAGVQVTSQSGRPGSGIDIVIRGIGSISQTNKPLFVVDGFPMEDPDNNLANLVDPNNIESIDVLKDASSTALYGARGSNGVIVITTKRGKQGQARVDYTSYYGVNRPTKYLKLMSPYQFVQAQSELYSLINQANPYLSNGRTLDEYRNVKGADFQDLLMRDGFQQNQSISVSGGNGGTQYSLSGNYFTQDGIIVNSSFRRYQGKLTLDQKIGKKVKVGGYITYTSNLINGENPQTGNGSNSVFNRVFTYRPISYSGQDESLVNGLYDPDIDNSNTLANYLANPIINQKNIIRRNNNVNVYVNAYLEYTISKVLKFSSRGFSSNSFIRAENFNGSNTASGGFWNPNGVNGSVYNYRYDYYGNSNLLTYKNAFNKKHNVTLVGAMDIQYSNTRSAGYAATQLPDESLGISGLDAGNILVPPNSSISNSTLTSFIGSAEYNYDGKYYFTGNFRADGSSKFVQDNKWAYFPSMAVKWKLSKEKFLNGLNWLSDGNVRFSYGTTGNNRVDNFATYGRIVFGEPMIINGVVQPLSAYPASLQNPELRWEKTIATNLGFDFSFFKNRLSFTVDLYKRKTDDLLYSAPLPYNTGYSSIIRNIASIQNKGIEITLKGTPLKRSGFEYNTSFNITLNKNELLSLTDPTENAILTTVPWEALYGSISSYISKIGGPMGQIYGLVSDGLYQYRDFDQLPNGTYVLKPGVPLNKYSPSSNPQPGDNRYVDINQDGNINEDDWVVIGNGYPLFFGGWSNNFRYKNFDLNLFFQWSYGNDILNANRIWFSNGLGIQTRYTFLPAQNAFEEYANRWTPTNQNTDIPKMNRASQVVASQFVEDGSFIRLKTINIGYTIPSKILSRYKMRGVRVYVSTNNIFTLTKYKGYDPEVSAYQTALSPGVDFSAYPRPFTITGGLNISL